MAVTTSVVRRDDVFGNLKVTVTNVTLDSSYANGGEPLTADDLGLNVVFFAVCNVLTADAGVVAAAYDVDDELLIAHQVTATYNAPDVIVDAGGAAVSTDLDGVTVQVVAFGY